MNAIETAAPLPIAAAQLPSMATRAASPATHARECLTFRLGDEEYGMDILKVQEIRGYESPTRIANAPAFFKGVLNLRGVIVPIIDLRLNLRLEQAAYDAFTVTIILNVADRVVGAVVDSVSDVIDLAAAQIKSPPEFNSVVETRYITGIGTIVQGERKRMLILVDIERLISSADVGLLEQTLQ